MRRAGAASLAMLAMPLGAVPTTQATQASCPRHGSGPCRYVERIDVVFDSCAVAMDVLPRDDRFERCGRIFYGVMTVTVITVSRNPFRRTSDEKLYPVQSGGYLHYGGGGTKIPDPSKNPEGVRHFETDANKAGSDTSCPAGEFQTSTTPTTGSVSAGNSSHRYNVTDTGVHEMGRRTDIQIHMPGASTGCIAFRDTENDPKVAPKDQIIGKKNLLEFEKLMADTVGCACAKAAVPTSVKYRVPGADGIPDTPDDIWPVGNLGIPV